MNKLAHIIEYENHALALEWSVPSTKELVREWAASAEKRGVMLEVTIFDAPAFSIKTARQVKEAQSRKLTNDTELLIVISSRSFLTEAQNALLKSLEEPTAGVRIVIITPSHASLLDTVLSRATPVRISSDTAGVAKTPFSALTAKERLAHIAEVLADDTKTSHITFLERLEHELTQKLTNDDVTDRDSLSAAGRKILEAKNLILSGSTASKYLLEEVALSFPRGLRS